jgi:hypothetical protein
VNLIAFSEDGDVGPSCSATDATHAMEYKMATTSIERYHLRHPRLVERRMLLLRQVKAWIEEADGHLRRHSRGAGGGGYSRSVARDRMADIRSAAGAEAEFSTAVRHLISSMATTSASAASIKAIL